MLLIGSAAIKHHYPDFPRTPKDLDYIGAGESSREVEYLSNPVLEHLEGIALPEVLLTLKASHIFWDINWDKHMYDIVFLFEKGNEINTPLFYDLYNHWINIHGKNKRSDLTLSADEFFDNALKEYDHDYLHTIINPSPTYLKVLKGEVEPDEEKFNLLSHEEKEALVREEVYVMAYERMRHINYVSAYRKMLKKFIMHHAPIWEVFFILKNYRSLHKPLINYQNLLNHGITIKN